jgi:transposase
MIDKFLALQRPPPLPDTLEDAHRVIGLLWDDLKQLAAEVEKQARRIEELEEKLDCDSSNSSTPPSQDRMKGRTDKGKPKPSGRKKGGQPGHVHNARALLPETAMDVIERYYPEARCGCGGEIQPEPEPSHRHQVFDLPEVRYTVTEYQRFEGCCDQCGRRVQARLPDWVPAGQTGPGLVAWISLMSGHYRLSTRCLQSLLESQWGLSFSLGALSEAQGPVGEWLQPLHEQVGEAVRLAPVAHADETTHYREQNRYWLWVLCTTQAAYFVIHASRGKRAARELLGGFMGILLTDRHGGYNDYPDRLRQFCWAHIIRNLEAMAGRQGEAGELGRWLVRVARLIIRMERAWRRSDYRSPHYRRRLEALRLNFKAALEQGAARHAGQRTGNACQHLLRDEAMPWTFLGNPGIPLTNNTAEQALRPYVVWRKISFFSQSDRGDVFRARVLTVTETCKRLKISAYNLLRRVCEQGQRNGEITVRLPLPHTPALLSAPT